MAGGYKGLHESPLWGINGNKESFPMAGGHKGPLPTSTTTPAPRDMERR